MCRLGEVSDLAMVISKCNCDVTIMSYLSFLVASVWYAYNLTLVANLEILVCIQCKLKLLSMYLR